MLLRRRHRWVCWLASCAVLWTGRLHAQERPAAPPPAPSGVGEIRGRLVTLSRNVGKPLKLRPRMQEPDQQQPVPQAGPPE